MKTILAFLIFFCFCTVAYGSSVYNDLCIVNAIWKEKESETYQFPAIENRTQQQWIQLHLSMVEQSLRFSNTANLSEEQRTNRSKALDHLHEYWQAGAFPQNTYYSYRTPIFIDKYDNFCAVGYLVKATGYEGVSRMIAARSNFSYVRDMHYPELEEWAKRYGFTTDELAWIQPGYGPNCILSPIAGGTNGSVKELFVDGPNNILYVGGNFDVIGGTTAASHIAAVTATPTGYLWHNLGTGVNGPVTAISKFNTDIFVAGSFTTAGSVSVTNVARWDGAAWTAAGCLDGEIKELIQFDGSLYATGDFAVCPGNTSVNFAKWNGADWIAIQGLTGVVNTGEVIGTDLFLGGAFSYNGNTSNAIRWNATSGFMTFDHAIVNEVNDFELFNNDVYAACRFTSGTDTTLLLKLSVNNWVDLMAMGGLKPVSQLSVNTLCALNNSFLAGGDFNDFYPISAGYSIGNCLSIYDHSDQKWFIADNPINKLIVFNGRVIAGGDFSLNIGERRPTSPLATYAYPVVACKGNNGKVDAFTRGGIPPYRYKWTDLSTNFSWLDGETIENLTPGSYSLETMDDEGDTATSTAIVYATFIDKELQYDSVYRDLKVIGFTIDASYTWMDCIADTALLWGGKLNSYPVSRDGDYYCIVDQNGCRDTTDCISVRYIPDNVINVPAKNGLDIYPNPFGEELTITASIALRDIAIIDVSGRIVLSKTVSGDKTIQINTSSLSAGFYTVIVHCADGQFFQHKIIK